jgi:CO/xanthine dehydrogenase Mo-binding subunit
MRRRDFLRVSLIGGGTLCVGISFTGCVSPAVRRMEDEVDRNGHFQPNAFLTITPDDEVRVGIGKSEMGQGVLTGHATLVAEELEVPVERIEVFHAQAGPDWQTAGMQITGGSTSTPQAWEPFRKGAAREMLIGAAAARWGVPRSECRAEDGAVVHAGSDRTARYGELAQDAAKQPIPGDPPLKKRADFKAIGKPRQRVDLQDKINGAPVFGIDVEVPNMARAAVIPPPVYGAEPRRVKADAARKMPGVLDIFPTETGVLVVAERYWQAERAARAVEVEWGATRNDRLDSDVLIAAAIERANEDPSANHRDDGDADDVLQEAASERRLSATYSGPYLAHAPLEPINAVVDVRDDAIEVWAGTQFQSGVQGDLAVWGGVDRDQVIVHTTLLGGGFGYRALYMAVMEAAAASKRVGRPVQVIHTREHDTRGGWYRPAMIAKLDAALDDKGRIRALSAHALSQSLLDMQTFLPSLLPSFIPDMVRFVMARTGQHLADSGTIPDVIATEGLGSLDYDTEHVKVGYTPINADLPVLFWRSVGHTVNAFALESFVDELAHAAGVDPYEFRRQNLQKNDRKRAVLEEAARLGEWGKPAADGFAKGIACHKSFGTYVAEVVEAGVVDGRIVVRNVACAVDCGIAINPDIVRAQMEGAIIMGLTAAIDQRIDIKEGRVQQGNYDDFPVMRISESPTITVSIIDSDEPPMGVGEPGLPPAAPALANALFAATGKRLRSMPLQTALKEVG